MNGNTIEKFSIVGEPVRKVVIRELFCYRHPQTGKVVKKDYSLKPIYKKGYVPRTELKQMAVIEAVKRQIVRYNTQAVADGCKPIVDWWWEAPEGGG